jgi:sugar/nucleoside kinase (ribokinase family)
MTHAPFATFGNISIDDLVFDDGTTMWKVPGGNSIYSALGLALWGERPAVIAPVGPEYPIEALGDRLDLSFCRPIDRTLRNWGLYEEDGSRIFTFRTKTKNWLEFSPTMADINAFSCDFMHLAPLRWEQQTEFALVMRSKGTKTISVDPDDRYLAELQHEPMLRLLHAVDLFLPSKQDVDALMPGRTPHEILVRLRELAPDLPLIVIKRGADGVIMHAAGESDYLMMPTIAETVIDTTGAGDAFSGGTLAGYARTGSTLEAVLWGSVSASFAVAAMGPSALVEADRGEAKKRVERLRGRVEARTL